MDSRAAIKAAEYRDELSETALKVYRYGGPLELADALRAAAFAAGEDDVEGRAYTELAETALGSSRSAAAWTLLLVALIDEDGEDYSPYPTGAWRRVAAMQRTGAQAKAGTLPQAGLTPEDKEQWDAVIRAAQAALDGRNAE